MKETKSPDVMMSWLPILECYFNKLDPKDYERLYDEIYETIYGEVLSDEKAMKLVQNMKPLVTRCIRNIDAITSPEELTEAPTNR